MKQNSFDAQQLYKEYMQTVNADPAAIGDILSGERQPVNHGAKIKHSTGKMATVTAAAAVIAVCAGIGLSNMNANDTDSKVKSAASTVQTTTPAVTTAAQTTKEQALAKKEDNFKTEVTEMYCSDHSLRVTVKLTALNDEAKKYLDADAEKRRSGKSGNIYALLVEGKKIACVSSTTPVISGNSLTTTVVYGRGNNFADGEQLDIVFSMDGTSVVDPDLYSAHQKVTITVKKNMTERVFKSEDGTTLYLSDLHFNLKLDNKELLTYDKYKNQNFEIKLSDGSIIDPFNTQMIMNRSDENGNKAFAFEKKIDSSKVTAIKYAGKTFTPQ